LVVKSEKDKVMKLTPEDLALLEKSDNPEIAAVAKKLKESGNDDEHLIPKSRFDEVNLAKKKAEEDLKKFTDAQTEAQRKALEEQNKYKELADLTVAEKKALEAKLLAQEELLKSEKTIADAFRESRKKRRAELIELIGKENLLPEMEQESFSIESLEKVATGFGKVETENGVPKRGTGVDWSKLSSKEREQMIQSAKDGDLKIIPK
jgi:hypothetical protein